MICPLYLRPSRVPAEATIPQYTDAEAPSPVHGDRNPASWTATQALAAGGGDHLDRLAGPPESPGAAGGPAPGQSPGGLRGASVTILLPRLGPLGHGGEVDGLVEGRPGPPS